MGKKIPEDFRYHQIIVRWEEQRGHSVLTMKRIEWEKLKANKGDSFNLIQAEYVNLPWPEYFYNRIQLVEVCKIDEVYKIKLYRMDPKDPVDEQINVDEYDVYENITPVRYDRDEIIKAATTDFDDDLKNLDKNYIYLVKRSPDEITDHHRPDLPPRIKIQNDDEKLP